MAQYKIKRCNRYVFFFGLLICLGFFLVLTADLAGSVASRTSGFYSSSHALVIGIDNYEHWKDLKYAVKDASIVGEELISMEFSVTSKYNPTSSELEDILEDFFYKKTIDNNSRLFIWFSGHGHTMSNEGFIVPADAPGPENELEFKRKALPIRRFEEWLRLTNAKHVYMVFDACLSTGMFTKGNNNQTIAVANKNPVRQFLCSCVADQDRPYYGAFREMFLKAIKNEVGADVNGDSYLTASELGQFIEGWMKSKIYKGQTPNYGKLKDFDKGDFLFLTQVQTDNFFQVIQDNLKSGDKGTKMIMIPAGTFRMGAIQRKGYKDEQPVHSVRVGIIAVGLHEVTFAEYDLFCEKTGRKKPNDNGWGRGNRPVINVSWEDAVAYTEWLSEQTGYKYRLPTEAEWEYFARAGTDTDYWWGNEIGRGNASCYGCGAQWGWDAEKKTAPVGSFQPNSFGIFDTVGNVWEWTCSEYTDTYVGKETTCLDKEIATGLEVVVIRGGSWDDEPKKCRVSHRKAGYPGERSPFIGFRVVREVK